MRTSLNEIRQIEAFLLKQMSPQEQLFTQARMLIDPAFRQKVNLQREVYTLLRRYQYREESERMFWKLMNDPSRTVVRHRILNLFKK